MADGWHGPSRTFRDGFKPQRGQDLFHFCIGHLDPEMLANAPALQPDRGQFRLLRKAIYPAGQDSPRPRLA